MKCWVDASVRVRRAVAIMAIQVAVGVVDLGDVGLDQHALIGDTQILDARPGHLQKVGRQVKQIDLWWGSERG